MDLPLNYVFSGVSQIDRDQIRVLRDLVILLLLLDSPLPHHTNQKRVML